MREGKPIDLRGWLLIRRQYWQMKVAPGKRILVQSCNNPTPDDIKNGASVSIHQRYFGEEVVTVLSTYFFGRGPYIQLWHSDEFPLLEGTLNELAEFQTFKDQYFQNFFYKAVKVGGVWLQLEKNENIEIPSFKYKNGEITNVSIAVVQKDDPEVIIKKFKINK